MEYNSAFLDGFLTGVLFGLGLALVVYRLWLKRSPLDNKREDVDQLIKEFETHFKETKKRNSDFRGKKDK